MNDVPQNDACKKGDGFNLTQLGAWDNFIPSPRIRHSALLSRVIMNMNPTELVSRPCKCRCSDDTAGSRRATDELPAFQTPVWSMFGRFRLQYRSNHGLIAAAPSRLYLMMAYAEPERG
jgi:hypothetical protein